MAGQVLELRIWGNAIVDFARAFAPVTTQDSTDLTVDAIHDPQGTLPCVSVPTSSGDGRWLISSRRQRTLVDTAGRLHSLHDGECGLWWAAGEIDDHPWELARPFHQLIDWWGAERGLWLVHAGAVATAEGAVLLAGGPGSGKSTTCLTALDAGLGYLGDDLCLVEPGTEPLVHRVYSTARLSASSLERLPHLAGCAGIGPMVDGKSVYYIAECFPEQIRTTEPLVGILLPSVGPDDRTTLAPANGAAALRSLAPSSTLNFPGTARAKFRALAQLTRSVPAQHIRLGSDPSMVGSQLRAAIAS